MVVLLVGLQVLGEVADTLGQDGDLHVRVAGVMLVGAELPDQLCGALFRDADWIISHFSSFSYCLQD